jgi:hypothetical protein
MPAAGHVEGSECERDEVERRLEMDASAAAAVHGIGAREVVAMPHHSEGVGRDTVCGMLVERLQDASFYFVRRTGPFSDCVFNFRVCSA